MNLSQKMCSQHSKMQNDAFQNIFAQVEIHRDVERIRMPLEECQ